MFGTKRIVIDKEKDHKYNTYIEERNRNIESKARHAELFDKSILTLAAGAFGLSLTFIDKIDKQTTVHNLYWLCVAWGMFAISMLSTLISFRFGINAFEKQIRILDSDYENDKKDVMPRRYTIIIECLNWASILSFIIGTVSLIVFSILNIKVGLSVS